MPPARITVCVATYHRPGGLRRLLDGLGRLRFEGDLSVVVVDNDAAGPARRVCDAAAERLPFPVRYCIEPRPGIAHARNTALAAVPDDADLVAFIDDDEAPDPDWLLELLHVQREHDADVVTGPVLPRFECMVPRWITRGGFFECRRWPTGTRLDRAYTNNVLFRAKLLREHDTWFDPRLGLTGGSDAHWFQGLARAGRKIIWADRALVHEWHPPTRTTLSWLVRRMYRVGNAAAFVSSDLAPRGIRGLATAALTAIRGVAWLVRGAPLALLGWAAGRHHGVQGVRWVAYGTGLLSGLAGARYVEYRRTHGS